ncbi:hypothetical protein HPB51_027198 [Rhipicephalus microplus]|uniref:Uncharacterized protein n=1 Tax=Rhipicephalus microplus TaxID=6941 RepID=A0A9J6D0Z1_RHIMP|nr:hypothetical protein HPB51_027198 [Rhipicephalus microplus]
MMDDTPIGEGYEAQSIEATHATKRFAGDEPIDQIFRAHRAWLGAATRESELETRVCLPVIVVNRHGLYVIMAVFGGAILGGACVLGYFDMLNRMLKRYAVPSPPGSTPQTRSVMATLVPTT